MSSASSAFVFLALAGCAYASMLSADFSNNEWKERPVAKVINLLRDMQAQLEKESSNDQEMYDEMVCWCKTNEKAKTKAVAEGTSHDKMLTELIPSLAAKATKLEVEIEGLDKEIAGNDEALATATTVRAKELEDFRGEESSAVESISGLRSAISALSGQHALTQETLLQVNTAFTRVQSLDKANVGFLQNGPAHLQHAVAAFLQEHKDGSPHQEYASQSGEIFGILKGMKESFEQNLKNSQEEEKEGLRAFNELKAAKNVEITDAKEQVESKAEAKAATDEQLSTSKEDLEDTRSTVSSDKEFLMDLTERCNNMDHTFEQRRKVRAEEIEAVGQAIKILDGEEAHANFGRTLSFVQLNSVAVSDASGRMAAARKQTARILFAAAKRLSSPQLSLLATAVKDDVFAKIKTMIDKLIENLERQQADEVDDRNECIEDFNTNEKETYAKNSIKDDIVTKIESLALLIKKLVDEIEVAKAEIADMQIEIKQASMNREKENDEFQVVVGDQVATREILQKALDKLKSFYDKKAAAMLQLGITTTHHRSKQSPPPQGFGEYKKQGSSAGAMGMIEMIIRESQTTEDQAYADEQEGQNNYENFIKDSNGAITGLNKSIADKTERKATADGDKLRAEDDLARAEQDLAALAKINEDLHAQCDFLMKNFEERQASRTAEMEALRQAKASMSGAVME